jgi:hypothetical protein
MATVHKLSVSLRAEDARWARARAKKLKTSVSAVLTEAIRRERQAEARRQLLDYLGGGEITRQEAAAIEAEWRGEKKR